MNRKEDSNNSLTIPEMQLKNSKTILNSVKEFLKRQNFVEDSKLKRKKSCHSTKIQQIKVKYQNK